MTLEVAAQERSQKASVAHKAVDTMLLRMSIGAQFSSGRRELCWKEDDSGSILYFHVRYSHSAETTAKAVCAKAAVE